MQDKARLARELQVFDELKAEGWLRDEVWTVDGFDLVAHVTLVANGVDYRLRLTYPQHFPNVPPWIMPADGETRLSDHQFGAGGSFCLEYGPDNWIPNLTGEDILRSTFKLLSTENPKGVGEKGVVEVGHMSAPFQWGFESYSVLLEHALFESLKAGPVPGLKAIRWTGPDAYPVFLFDADATDPPVNPPAAGLYSDFLDTPVFSTAAAPPLNTNSRAALIEAMGFDEGAKAAIYGEGSTLLIFGVGRAPLAFSVFPEDGAYGRRWTPIRIRAGVRSGGAPARASARIAIIGAGSVGSKVAESLVRSGIRNALLVDGDIFLPENLERNALDWRDVGARKVEAVRAKVKRIAPDAQITIEAKKLNWQGSSRVLAATVATIGDCDLIIDATGETGASLMVGAIAAAESKPFISAEVFEGGIGALVAACLPNATPPYAVARGRFLGWCAEQGGAFPAQKAGGYEGHDDDGTPIVADDAAVTIAAGYVARVALDIIDGAPPPRPRAWLLIGFRDRWVFGTMGPLIHVDVGDPPPPPPPVDPTIDAFVEARIKEVIDAPTTAN